MSETTVAPVPLLTAKEVEGRVGEVLRRHEMTTVPINPVTLAQRVGIPIRNAEFDDPNMAGMIVKRGDQVSMLVRGGDPPLRKRFTIAHELGHYFLHLGEDGEFVDRDANLFRLPSADDRAASPDRRREIQANLFAAALLMPEAELRLYWKERKSIAELARIFQVSPEAMGYRLDALGLD